MHIITSSENLIAIWDKIDTLYQNHGKSFQHSPQSLLSVIQSEPDVRVYISDDFSALLAVTPSRFGGWKSIIESYPLLKDSQLDESNAVHFIDEVVRHLGGSIYFPLIYRDPYNNYILKDLIGATIWKRLPSCSIEYFSRDRMTEKLTQRYGNRFGRQKNKFEKRLRIRRCTGSDENHRSIVQIELNSWKRECGQDLITRNQLEYYTNLIKSGLATVTVAFDQSIPVAYRIDSICKKTCYAIKWSYDNDYRKFSPGFYLVAIDLPNYATKQKLTSIDLYGSPDFLKDLIKDHEVDRLDVGYPHSGDIEKTRQNRQSFDLKVNKNYQKGQSIKNIYTLENQL